MDDKIAKRQEMERQIVRKVIDDTLATGRYTLSVFDGEEETVKDSGDAERIFEAMFSTDEDRLLFLKGGKQVGWVCFIYGNDGWDVIADYTGNLEMVLDGAILMGVELEEKANA